MASSKKAFLDYFTEREDRFYAEMTVVSVLLGIVLSIAVFAALESHAAWQHAYLNWYFWPVFGAPLLVFFLAFVLPTWNKRRKVGIPRLPMRRSGGGPAGRGPG